MARYFYVKTCYEKPEGKRKKDKKIRVRVLGGQIKDNHDLDVSLNVSCSHPIRDAYPIGTVFGCDNIIPREQPRTGKRFYKVPTNDLFAIEIDGDIVSDDSRMVMDYEDNLPYMINQERRLKLDWVLSDDDLPLFD